MEHSVENQIANRLVAMGEEQRSSFINFILNTKFCCCPWIQFERKNVLAEFWPMQSSFANMSNPPTITSSLDKKNLAEAQMCMETNSTICCFYQYQRGGTYAPTGRTLYNNWQNLPDLKKKFHFDPKLTCLRLIYDIFTFLGHIKKNTVSTHVWFILS